MLEPAAHGRRCSPRHVDGRARWLVNDGRLGHTQSVAASIRARQLANNLEALERVTGGKHARVFEAMRPESLAQIRDAGRFEWVPVELDIEFSERVFEELGPSIASERARESLRLTFDKPLARPILEGVEKLFGLEPSSVLRQAPRAWNLVFRDAGRLSYAVCAGSRRLLTYDNVAPVILASRVYLDALASAMASVLDLCKVDGTVEVTAVDLQRARVEFEAHWY